MCKRVRLSRVIAGGIFALFTAVAPTPVGAQHDSSEEYGAPPEICNAGCECHQNHSPICFTDHDDVCSGSGCIFHYPNSCAFDLN